MEKRVERSRKPGVLGRAFVDDAPAPALAQPVLPFFHDVRQIARSVVLIEGDHDHLLLTWSAEQADIGQAHLHPALGAVDLPLVAAPGIAGPAVRRAAGWAVGGIAARVPDLPVPGPLV